MECSQITAFKYNFEVLALLRYCKYCTFTSSTSYKHSNKTKLIITKMQITGSNNSSTGCILFVYVCSIFVKVTNYSLLSTYIFVIMSFLRCLYFMSIKSFLNTPCHLCLLFIMHSTSPVKK